MFCQNRAENAKLYGQRHSVNIFFAPLHRQARGKPHPLCSARGQRHM